MSIREIAKRSRNHLQLLQSRTLAAKQFHNFSLPAKLHIGCGTLRFDGWVNIDLERRPGIVDIQLDATQPFPFEDNSCQFIYSEHFLEHLTVEQGLHFLRECHRLLIPGGALRIAMPSLD